MFGNLEKEKGLKSEEGMKVCLELDGILLFFKLGLLNRGQREAGRRT
jgi:hypothetical protein